MPWSALPEHLNSPEKWNGKDDDKFWFTKWRKSIKGWFAFGPRATEWWARWRETPTTLFYAGGSGEVRLEDDECDTAVTKDRLNEAIHDKWYLSRIQYWSRWHIQIQWPFFIAFHIYWKEEDVPPSPWRPLEDGIKHMIYFYWGFSRDSDKVYWLTLVPFIGGVFK
jgi:hypothetical protein